MHVEIYFIDKFSEQKISVYKCPKSCSMTIYLLRRWRKENLLRFSTCMIRDTQTNLGLSYSIDSRDFNCNHCNNTIPKVQVLSKTGFLPRKNTENHLLGWLAFFLLKSTFWTNIGLLNIVCAMWSSIFFNFSLMVQLSTFRKDIFFVIPSSCIFEYLLLFI